MKFRKHSELKDKHAFLSGSKYHWVNYDEEKLSERYLKAMAVKKGTELHALAAECIRLGVRLPRSQKTLNMYVNDCITKGLVPEQPLYFSENCFGTADAISFNNNKLQIFDLKTGETKTSFMQLYIYAAMFCLEYDESPNNIEIELRIYQNNEVLTNTPDPTDILYVINKIKTFNALINALAEREDV